MSDKNTFDGQYLYAAGDAETKEWFHKQWRIWPERADQRLTTNLSFHYGGILAYRIDHDGEDPDMSPDLANNIKWMDRNHKAEKESNSELPQSQSTSPE